MSRRLGVALFVVYIIIGVVLAAGYDYFEHLGAREPAPRRSSRCCCGPPSSGSTCNSSRGIGPRGP